MGRGGGGTKPKSKPLLFLYFNLCSGLDYVKQQAKMTGQKAQNSSASHHILFSSDRCRDSRGAWEAISLFITTESRGAQTHPLALNHLLPQDAVSPWTVPNVAGEQLMLLWPLLTSSKDKDFRLHICQFRASPQTVTHSNNMKTDT